MSQHASDSKNGAKPLSATVSSLASRHHYSMQKAKWVGFTHLADNQKPVIEKKRLIASFFSYHSLSVQRIEIRQEHLCVQRFLSEEFDCIS